MAIKPVTVSQVNGFIKRILQTDPLLSNLTVIGEISNLKHHGSGHVYFTLKDRDSKLQCFLPAETFAKLRYALEEGMEITASGSITVFERGGSYSLLIRDILVEGRGNLALAFEKLRSKLEAEGLFDDAIKRAIPKYPSRIGVVTSDTGAAVHDIISVISARNDQIHILIYPCLVQGPSAAADIATAITEINHKFPQLDTLIVGRGGGSMEELWAFNEEIVARAIRASKIPVISAVGHESDVTIADYAADRRAATPTEAAVIASSDQMQLRRMVLQNAEETRASMKQHLLQWETKTARYDMAALKQQLLQRLRWEEGLSQKGFMEMRQWMTTRIEELQTRIRVAKASLDSGNPSFPLQKGYAMIFDQNDRITTGVKDYAAGDSLTVIFKDGKINCSVKQVWRGQNGNEKE